MYGICRSYPIRAKIAQTPETSDFTSIKDRIIAAKHKDNSDSYLAKFGTGCLEFITQNEYIELVDFTGRQIVSSSKGSIPEHLLPILVRTGIKPSQWCDTSCQIEDRFFNVIGKSCSLIEQAASLGRSWFRGISACRNAFT